nr:hypothetical protein Y76A2A.3 - Caenorhabditis elegans [Caenorhabditis elegans]
MSENVSLLDGSPLPSRPSTSSIPRPSPSKNIQLLVDFGAPKTDGNVQETMLEIKGMTCNSCVKNIQDVIGAKPGIHSIQVNLKEENAKCSFDTTKWTAEKVAEAVDDMGFDCKVLKKVYFSFYLIANALRYQFFQHKNTFNLGKISRFFGFWKIEKFRFFLKFTATFFKRGPRKNAKNRCLHTIHRI